MDRREEMSQEEEGRKMKHSCSFAVYPTRLDVM